MTNDPLPQWEVVKHQLEQALIPEGEIKQYEAQWNAPAADRHALMASIRSDIEAAQPRLDATLKRFVLLTQAISQAPSSAFTGSAKEVTRRLADAAGLEELPAPPPRRTH